MRNYLLSAFILLLSLPQLKATKETVNNYNIDKKIFLDSLSGYINQDHRLKNFYQDNKNTPLWFGSTLELNQIKGLLTILGNSKEHGLSPELFKKKRIEQLTDSISKNLYLSDSKRYAALARLEALSTRAVINYVKTLKFGYLNPRSTFPDDYFIETIQPDSLYYAYINKLIIISPIGAMMNAQPMNTAYVRLQNKLSTLDSIKHVKIAVISSKEYKLNDADENITLIAKRLMLTGEYKPHKTDSLSNILDQNLLDAINKFREENCLHIGNEIGSATINALNRPLEYYYKKILANLERYRWRKKIKNNNRRVEVNIAPFYLTAYDGAKSVLEMNVCAGSTDNRTPLMQSNINSINLNPVWYVPRSITQKELYHSIKKNPDYLKRKNMKLSKNGKEVNIASIDWSKTSAETFNYSISQESGDGNSLGRMKFLFPNRFSVYLHDTPSKAAFNYKNRAVSHGCIRLQKPIEFVMYCTSNLQNRLYRDRILYSIEQTPESEEGKKQLQNGKLKKLPNIINIERTVPLTIDYYTVFLKPDQESLFYTDDVYDLDSLILKYINLQ